MYNIYDESGIVIGEARPLIESTDIDMDILADEVLPTSGIVVEEACNGVDRSHFVMEYLLARENSNVHIRDCW